MVLLKIIKLLLCLSFFNQAYALVETKLPILLTKQSIFNLRWVSLDGERTYYQRASGDLILSTRYRVIEILKGAENTHYNIVTTRHRKNIVFLKDEYFHTWLGIRHPKEIYASAFTSERPPELIGSGIKPRLHLNDEWVSYFDPLARVIHLVNIKHKVLKYQIQINNNLNPYFVPEIIMVDKDTVVFTDLNSKGHTGILIYKKLTNKIEPSFKVTDIREKIEFCKKDSTLLIGVFGTDPSKRGSQIFRLPLQTVDFKKLESIYKSELNDIGNIECDHKEESFYFTKNVTEAGKKEAFEIAKMNLKNKELKIITDLTYATELINLDGRLLVQYRGKFYVLKGEENLRKDDIFKL